MAMQFDAREMHRSVPEDAADASGHAHDARPHLSGENIGSAGATSALLPVIAKFQRQSLLSDTECDALLTLPSRVASVGRGRHLTREDDKAGFCCALLSGFAFRHKSTSKGARQILSLQMRGDIVNLQSVGLAAPDYSVQALTPTIVAYIPTTALLSLASEHPGIAAAFWADTLIDAAIGREWLLNLGRRNAQQRISHLFCELAVRENRAGAKGNGDYFVPLTQEQIGDATGLTSVHVNRTIQAMRAEGFIRISSQRMEIVDWRALVAAGDFSRAYLHQSAMVAR